MYRLVIAMLLPAAVALAQTSTGSLTGLVTDNQEGRIPGVSLRLTQPDPAAMRSAEARSRRVGREGTWTVSP